MTCLRKEFVGIGVKITDHMCDCIIIVDADQLLAEALFWGARKLKNMSSHIVYCGIYNDIVRMHLISGKRPTAQQQCPASSRWTKCLIFVIMSIWNSMDRNNIDACFYTTCEENYLNFLRTLFLTIYGDSDWVISKKNTLLLDYF